MKFHITIISTILISFATIGFVVLPEIYNDKIDKLIEQNDSLLIMQKVAMDWGLKANAQKELYYLLSDHLIIYKLLASDKNLIEQKKELITKALRQAALFAINSAISAGSITKEECRIQSDKVEILKTVDDLNSVYLKYIFVGATGTTEQEIIISNNKRNISAYKNKKANIWNVLLIIQTIGLITSIISLSIKSSKNSA